MKLIYADLFLPDTCATAKASIKRFSEQGLEGSGPPSGSYSRFGSRPDDFL